MAIGKLGTEVSSHATRNKINEIIDDAGGDFSGGGGGGATTTFADNAPTSPSQGDTWWDDGEAKMYIYSGTHWVQTNATGGGSVRGGGSYDTGYKASHEGTTVADGAALTINHNLGSSDLIVQVYLADDANGTNNIMLNNQTDGAASYLYDYQVQSTNDTSLTVQLNGSGYTVAPTSGTTALHYNYTDKFIRVVVLAGGNPIQYSSGWIDSDGTTDVGNGATMTITHNLGTTDVLIQAYVNSSASDTNAQMLGTNLHVTGGLYYDAGFFVTSLDSNSIVIQLGQEGYNDIDSNGAFTTTALTGKYIKVVISASVSGEPIAQMAKATIIFDGTSGSIGTGDKSHNVSSVTDNGTGDYTVNLTNGVATAIPVASSKRSGSSIGSSNHSVLYPEVTSATAIRIYCHGVDSNGNLGSSSDAQTVNLAVF